MVGGEAGDFGAAGRWALRPQRVVVHLQGHPAGDLPVRQEPVFEYNDIVSVFGISDSSAPARVGHSGHWSANGMNVQFMQ